MTLRLPLIILLVLACPAVATADWLLSPMLGITFGGDTDLVDLDGSTGRPKLTFGGSLQILGDGFLGVGADVGFLPGFFQRDTRGLVVDSSVTTLTGEVLVAMPARWTNEGLRPYASAGFGLMRVHIDDVLNVFAVSATLSAMSVGAGAMGFLTDRVGLRWDVRYFRSFRDETETDPALGTRHLTFWRGTMGVVLRY